MTISESAVTQRIRRRLRQTLQMLRKTRGERQEVDCGRYYVIDTNLNALLWHHVDLEAFAREHGVLRAHESVAE
jgi:nitric oxide reductase activation protein